MTGKKLLEISDALRLEALRVVRDSGVVEAWEGVGATVNMVGSVRSGLVMNNLDVDFHVYTPSGVPMLAASEAAIERLGRNPAIGDVWFRNLLDTPEECIEWHVSYKSTGDIWRLDMIHIRRGSAFDGTMERVTEALVARLDPTANPKAGEEREAILRIKHDAPVGEPAAGIEVYYAVLELGLRTYDEFAAWKRTAGPIDLLGWMP